MNGSNGMNGSMSTNGATAKGDAMGTAPAATPKFTDSPEQAAVIQAPSYEDVVVVAGAGSGKTYTMTRRIITLIDQGISPEKILGLTFTRKAASELLSRVFRCRDAQPGRTWYTRRLPQTGSLHL